MGKIEFSNCQDVRNQKRIQELDCPRCHESGGIEAFVKDGMLAEDGVCDKLRIYSSRRNRTGGSGVRSLKRYYRETGIINHNRLWVKEQI